MPNIRLIFDLSAATSRLTTPNERSFKSKNPAKHMLMDESCSPKNRLFFDSSVSCFETPSGSIHSKLTDAAQTMNTLLRNLFGDTYVYTAMEVLYFRKDAKSLHFGEYPAKVHWPAVPDPVSNPCCRRVADVIGKNYALVDVMPMRSKGLSGAISFTAIIKELMKNGAYVRALKVY